uniref:Uncharacterized protein n=1 Tax=Musca domestica TaxID=7370 RepID=A0A1I8MNR2_MUSDO
MLRKTTRQIILFLLNSLILPQLIVSKGLYAVSVVKSFNTHYLKEYNVHINPGNDSLDIYLKIAKTFDQIPWLSLALNLKDTATNRSRRLLQYDVNLCDLLDKGRGKFLTAWIHNFWRYGNLPRSCPFKEGVYYWNNLTLDTRNIPPFLMLPSHYEALIKIYFKKRSKKEMISDTKLTMEWK